MPSRITSAPPSSSSTLAGVRSATIAAHAHAGIDAAIRRAAAAALGSASAASDFFEQPLAVQIAGLDVIAIDDRQRPDARARQRRRVETAQRAAAHHDGVGAQQRLLPALSDARKKDLPRVALAFGCRSCSPMVTKLL